MKQIKLPKFPKELPDDVEVRDFDIGSGKFARVIMEVRTERHGETEMLVLYGQAYEMTKSGEFKQAPLAYPSRSHQSSQTVIASSIGRTVDIDDAWLESATTFNPEQPGDVKVITGGKPTAAGTTYGEQVWSKKDQKLYTWVQGIADQFAQAKINDLLTVLKTSNIRSGFAFRNRRNTTT